MGRPLLALLILVPTVLGVSQAGTLRMGYAAVDITPSVGTPMQAPQRPPFEIRLAQSPHDPLYVRAMVLQADGQQAALVACDLTSLPTAMVEEARREIELATSLSAASVMICATHTHTAPQVRPRFVARADADARAKTAAYVKALPLRIAEAVKLAIADLTHVNASAAIGREDSVSFNRRFVMRDGSIQTNPGKEDPALVAHIVRPDGPIDPDVGVVAFTSQDGAPRATLVNFAMHLDTVGGNRPSADFPAQIGRLLADAQGEQHFTLFAMGAAGNINHYDLLDPARVHRTKSVGESRRIGTILTGEVLRTYRKLAPISASRLAVARQTVRLEMPAEKGRLLSDRYGNPSRFFDGEVEVYNVDGKQQFDAEVQVIALGDELAWVGFPGEMFVELGLALKQASPFRYTLIHTLANGSIGYVPNRKGYPHGAYEATASRCAPGSGERLVETATQLLIDVKQAGKRLPSGLSEAASNKDPDR
jgi:hypothetical protein